MARASYTRPTPAVRSGESMSAGKLVPASAAARCIGVHRRTVIRWIIGGYIDGVRIRTRWYVYRDALSDIITRRGAMFSAIADVRKRHE